MQSYFGNAFQLQFEAGLTWFNINLVGCFNMFQHVSTTPGRCTRETTKPLKGHRGEAVQLEALRQRGRVHSHGSQGIGLASAMFFRRKLWCEGHGWQKIYILTVHEVPLSDCFGCFCWLGHLEEKSRCLWKSEMQQYLFCGRVLVLPPFCSTSGTTSNMFPKVSTKLEWDWIRS